MLALRDWQQGFAAAVLDGAEDEFARYIRTRHFPSARRLQIYRNNSRLNLTGALQAAYPVVCRLVGEGFFHYAAAAYSVRHPSHAGDLHRYGAAFAAFLQTFEPTAELVYLPDVARLEWSCHQVFHAARHAPLDPRALMAIPPERQGELRFRLHPAAQLLASPFPILRIWQANQPDSTAEHPVDLAAGGVKLLIFRGEDLEIRLLPLSAGAFALLHAFVERHAFAAACERAMAAQADFDLPTCFSRWVAQGVVTAFDLPDPSFPIVDPGEPA